MCSRVRTVSLARVPSARGWVEGSLYVGLPDRPYVGQIRRGVFGVEQRGRRNTERFPGKKGH